MQTVLFLALVANSLDLLLSTLGIHYYHNREGNPLLAGVAHHHWWIFVLIKGALIPLLIVRLYATAAAHVLATAGLARHDRSDGASYSGSAGWARSCQQTLGPL
jgi:hypothetical protein